MPPKRKAPSNAQAPDIFSTRTSKRPCTETKAPQKSKQPEKAKELKNPDPPKTSKQATTAKAKAPKPVSILSLVRTQPSTTQLFAKRVKKVVVKESVLVRPTARTRWEKENTPAAVAKREVDRKNKAAVAEQERNPMSVGGINVRRSIVKRGRLIGGGSDQEEIEEDVVRARKVNSDDWMLDVGDVADNENAFPEDFAIIAISSTAGSKSKESTGLTDLPKELRDEIWRLVVVQPERFIDPNELFGKEQPDLAMVSQFIRADVLPIFYGENVFAVDIAPSTVKQRSVLSATKISSKLKGSEMASSTTVGPSKFEKWATVLEEKGWFSKIRKWCFTYEDGTNLFKNGSFIVSMVLRKPEAESWGADVEIHQNDVSCVFPAHDAFGTCVVQKTPDWLNTAVIQLLDAATASTFTGGMIKMLARRFQERLVSLGGFRCEQSVQKHPSGYLSVGWKIARDRRLSVLMRSDP